jgi:Ca2+-binding EF-hand superfamily protein
MLSLCDFLQLQAAGREDVIRTAFIEYDKNGSGVLSGEELEAALSAAGLKFTRHQAISLKRRLDKDKSGSVSIEEFLSALGIGAPQ